MTLQLLQGPTKALVGSALAALALAPSQAAQCASYFRQPYDDDVWQVGAGPVQELLRRGPLSAGAQGVKRAPPLPLRRSRSTRAARRRLAACPGRPRRCW